MCVGATKGTYRRDIKMIVNHDYIKYALFSEKIFLTDYTSKYCLLSIQLTFACIYTPQHTNFGCFVCVHVASSVFFCLTLYAFKAASPKFCHHAFSSGATLLCVGNFSHKIVLHRAAKKSFD